MLFRSAITSTGTIVVDLPNAMSLSGNIDAGNLKTGGLVSATGNIDAGNLRTAGLITSTGNITGGNLITGGRAILSGSEDLAPGGAANLSITATYFSTSSAETGTLSAGIEGLVKTFMMVADTGDMVITVTNAGWKSSGTGTMTFNDIGDGCTLQYINSKWYCVGNNGVVFG